MIARELGIRRVLVPRDAAIFCASGMLRTDLKHDFVRSHAAVLGDATTSRGRVGELADEMTAEADAVLQSEGIAPDRRRLSYALDLRYRGQYHEVPVAVGAGQLRSGAWDAIRDAFHERHDRLYGYALRDEATPVEMVSVRLSAVGETDKPPQVDEPRDGEDASHALKGRRAVFQPEAGDFRETPVYDGDRLRHGNRLEGPAIVEKVTTTIFVPAGFAVSVDALGGCVLEDRVMEELR
jgi:N-methylhydantoinase A